MNIGTHRRSRHDNYTISVDLSNIGTFTAATVRVVAGTNSSGTLVVTSPASVSASIATFRLSGGQTGDRDKVEITATNNTDTVCRSILVHTMDC